VCACVAGIYSGDGTARKRRVFAHPIDNNNKGFSFSSVWIVPEKRIGAQLHHYHHWVFCGRVATGYCFWFPKQNSIRILQEWGPDIEQPYPTAWYDANVICGNSNDLQSKALPPENTYVSEALIQAITACPILSRTESNLYSFSDFYIQLCSSILNTKP
jgi:hypothetical protein